MRSREAPPAFLHAACCHEHRDSTPGVPPAGLCSGSWCQVCRAASATPPYSLLLSSQLLLGLRWTHQAPLKAVPDAESYTDVARLLAASYGCEHLLPVPVQSGGGGAVGAHTQERSRTSRR